MNTAVYHAMLVQEAADGSIRRHITLRSVSDLPDHDVLIRVHFSSLNYKDALSATGHKGVTRQYPHTPGIDAAGVVAESRAPQFRPGDEVIVTGYDLGMNTPGGFGEYIRVPADWIVPLPTRLTLRESMIFGTAGFTAALSLLKLEAHGLSPADGDILVTGASGGVGCMAVALLAHNGYPVVAVTGKPEAEPFLRELGAHRILPRPALDDTSGRPLLKQEWSAVVETVGGNFLSTALQSTRRHGAVAACGNVLSAELHTTVFPFILRGITLYGIDSATSGMTLRREAWSRLAGPWKLNHLDRMARAVGLEKLDEEIERILAGRQQGRVLVQLSS
ncbi:MAG: YhdH/YhfP family quinone oxidoreductase [Acidobacteria bacterium]|nr:YhdH/YhfP family quinone oxidoreductase [Acidobacteriota bacterium]